MESTVTEVFETPKFVPQTAYKKVSKWSLANNDTFDRETDPEFVSLNSSKKFNLYDGWNRLKCGALVSFRDQTPSMVIQRWASVEDIEWELEDLGFDGVKLDTFSNYISFDEEIEKQLIRLGLHCQCGNGNSIALDWSDNGSSVILYDDQYKIELTPNRVIKALRSVKKTLPHASFWQFITNWKNKDWMADFKKFDEQDEVRYDCVLALEDVRLILKVYNGLSDFGQKCFNRWCEGDLLAMLELSHRLAD